MSFFCFSSIDYVVLEDNDPLSKALEDKRLPENLFRTLLNDNQGTTPILMRYLRRFSVYTECVHAYFVIKQKKKCP